MANATINNINIQMDQQQQQQQQPTVRRTSFSQPKPKVLRPFNTSEVKILLLENVNETAVKAFKKQGYQVETYSKALVGDELIEKIKDVHVIGIRSKTKLTKQVLDAAHNLLVIGCFCIGTNQVDLQAAATKGIAVFNSPFSNSRSVAELVIGEIITLARQLGDRNREMHQGVWNKVSKGCYEIRGKVLGIVGYGHIGSQLSVLAEAMGMTVYFYDVLQIMPLGTAKQVDTLEELLSVADFVSLHVPELEETKNMMGEREIMGYMKKGSYLLNNARGTVVHLPALAKALQSGHLAGAAVDVYPKEPAANGPHFKDYPDLLESPNLILTPHIGGSTEEAQRMIGIEVSTALIRFINEGGSLGAVNFPEIDLRAIREEEKVVRVLYIHKNVPGVLREINEIFADHNVEKQYSDSKGDVAYVMADIANVSQEDLHKLYDAINSTTANIRTRVLY
ncbi:d-3-phosphoglycerate dehydrogenase [Lichtheimia corymbifera JMRC:FSU:9682]|uniref:phosphoglycerate dehydrogenase n=1 Tax=Lichtheimia corymbifera JMRC:FSU:9682 TaxID=1263082 RepID=A0A068SAG1_9FUNG|nr:d-3-phosphoglycerate dehydrogenase [Lichtheimia corymbifera JMRC:FSU:9682]